MKQIFLAVFATTCALQACSAQPQKAGPSTTETPVTSEAHAETPDEADSPPQLTICNSTGKWDGSTMSIDCQRQRLTQADADALRAFGKPTNLVLSSNLKPEDLEYLRGLDVVRRLQLGGPEAYDDARLAKIPTLPSLLDLSLRHTGMSVATLEELQRFESLEQLDLRETSLDDSSVDAIVALSSLKSVNLNGTSITPEGIAKLRQQRPELRVDYTDPTKIAEADGAVLWSNGIVEFGGHRAALGPREGRARWDSASKWSRDKGDTEDSIAVEKFDAKRQVIHLQLDTMEMEEDPPQRQWVYLVTEDGLSLIFNGLLGTYSTTSLAFPGDGTAQYVTSDWLAHEKFNNKVQRVILGLKDGELIQTGTVATGKVINPEELSACPFVYVKGTDGDYELVGEILRNVRTKAMYTTQDLELPGVSGNVDVRLREEKDEVTYLDELYVVADGVRVEPAECGSASPEWCVADQKFHRMKRGDALDVRFDVPADAMSVVLYATGYYVPTPRHASR